MAFYNLYVKKAKYSDGSYILTDWHSFHYHSEDQLINGLTRHINLKNLHNVTINGDDIKLPNQAAVENCVRRWVKKNIDKLPLEE